MGIGMPIFESKIWGKGTLGKQIILKKCSEGPSEVV
jgi:hypothetical protein